MHLSYAGVGPQLNVRCLLNLFDQVLRHGAGKRVAADQNNHALCVLGEVHCRLTRGVCAAHDIDDFALAGQCFSSAATIIDPRALQPVYSRSFESTPLHPSRDHQRVARDLVPIHQLDDPVRTFCSDADSFLRRQDFHSETLGLEHGTPGQIAATEAGGKSKIVLNAGAHSGLTAGCFPLNHYCMQTFRGAIDGSGQPGRPSADNRQIIETGLGARPQSDLLRDVGGYTLKKLRPVGKQHHGEIASLRAQCLQEAFGFRIIGGTLDVNPLIRDTVARQEVPQLIGPRRPAGAQHPDSLEWRMVGSLPVIEQII